MSKNKMEDKIIAYLLGECEEEDAFEVEKLCREDSKWQAEKIRYGQVLGLLEESIFQTAPELLPEKEMKLTEEQRKEIKSLLDKDSESSKVQEDNVTVDEKKNDRKEDGMTEKENKDNKSKMIYWAPLAAAAVAAIIAYWGNPEKEAEKHRLHRLPKWKAISWKQTHLLLLSQVSQINKHSLQMPKLPCRMRSQIVQMRLSLCALPARSKRWRKRILMPCRMEKN